MIILGWLEVAVKVEVWPVVWPASARVLEPSSDMLEECWRICPPQALVIVFGDQAQCAIQFPVPGPRNRVWVDRGHAGWLERVARMQIDQNRSPATGVNDGPLPPRGALGEAGADQALLEVLP